MMSEAYLWAQEDWLDPEAGDLLAAYLPHWVSIAGVQLRSHGRGQQHHIVSKDAKTTISTTGVLITNEEPQLVNCSFVGTSRRQQEAGY